MPDTELDLVPDPANIMPASTPWMRPESKNVKADALSRSFCAFQLPDTPPEPILPPNIIVASLSSDLASDIKAAQQLAPVQTPTDKLFSFLFSVVSGDCHDSVFCGHPGIGATRELVSRFYWWPTLLRDVKSYVSACEVCARSKTPRTRPAGKLRPLPIPSKPWSHISIDFITDLPPSEGKPVLWVVVYRFSKMVPRDLLLLILLA